MDRRADTHPDVSLGNMWRMCDDDGGALTLETSSPSHPLRGYSLWGLTGATLIPFICPTDCPAALGGSLRSQHTTATLTIRTTTTAITTSVVLIT